MDRFRENKAVAYSNEEGLIQDQRLAMASTPDGSVWLVSYTSNTVQRFRQGRITTSKLPAYSRSDTTRILSLHADGNNRVSFAGRFNLAEEAGGKLSLINVPDIEKLPPVHAIPPDPHPHLWIT